MRTKGEKWGHTGFTIARRPASTSSGSETKAAKVYNLPDPDMVSVSEISARLSC
jgi:hypothetical protein